MLFASSIPNFSFATGLGVVLLVLALGLIFARDVTTTPWSFKGTTPVLIAAILAAIGGAAILAGPNLSKYFHEFWEPPAYLDAPDEGVAKVGPPITATGTTPATRKITFTQDPPKDSKWTIQLGESGAMQQVTDVGGREITLTAPFPSFVKVYYMQEKPSSKPSHYIVKETK